LDRFCTSILPRIHHNVRKLILQTISIELILRPFNYPNLTYPELFNFDQDIARRYFTSKYLTYFMRIEIQKYWISLYFCLENSIFRCIFKQQITDLVLHNNDEYKSETASKKYTTNVYTRIFVLFQNLKHLTVVSSSVNEYPPLSLRNVPLTTCFSSTLTVLCISVYDIGDCFSLLDGRLKQLNTFIVQIHYFSDSSLISRKMVS
jgi:hypothetical protein